MPGHTGEAPTTLADGSACPTGYIIVPGSSTFGTKTFCAMKYEAKDVGGVATSQATGMPWVNISQVNAKIKASEACDTCHLISEPERMTIAANVLSVDSNWMGGVVGSGAIYSGHNDNSPTSALTASADDNDGYSGTGNTTPSNQRRTLALNNSTVIWDLAGNIHEWIDATMTTNKPSFPGETTFGLHEWNNADLRLNGLPELSRPAAISATVAGYSSAQGIGQLYAYGEDSAIRAFHRGGSRNNESDAGVLRLVLGSAPTGAGDGIGFRVSR